ncbi:MAG TPA: hypothetical protein VIT23_01715 [Terrimicrobiaceae bacterium]
MKCALSLALALLVVGCATHRDFGTFDPASSEKALIRWQRRGSSLVYDAVCARGQGGSVVVRLYKQSPAPLAEFRLEPNHSFSAQGRLVGRGWTGLDSDAPKAFKSWISFLTAYQAAQTGSPEAHSPAIRVTSTKSGDKLKVLSVSNTQTGEVVSAIFN